VEVQVTVNSMEQNIKDFCPNYVQEYPICIVYSSRVSFALLSEMFLNVVLSFSVVRVLLSHGADVNSVSDTGSTPVRSACYIVRPGLHTRYELLLLYTYLWTVMDCTLYNVHTLTNT
jgi:hypothetical protein